VKDLHMCGIDARKTQDGFEGALSGR
jgi:hypothetical protein